MLVPLAIAAAAMVAWGSLKRVRPDEAHEIWILIHPSAVSRLEDRQEVEMLVERWIEAISDFDGLLLLLDPLSDDEPDSEDPGVAVLDALLERRTAGLPTLSRSFMGSVEEIRDLVAELVPRMRAWGTRSVAISGLDPDPAEGWIETLRSALLTTVQQGDLRVSVVVDPSMISRRDRWSPGGLDPDTWQIEEISGDDLFEDTEEVGHDVDVDEDPRWKDDADPDQEAEADLLHDFVGLEEVE